MTCSHVAIFRLLSSSNSPLAEDELDGTLKRMRAFAMFLAIGDSGPDGAVLLNVLAHLFDLGKHCQQQMKSRADERRRLFDSFQQVALGLSITRDWSDVEGNVTIL